MTSITVHVPAKIAVPRGAQLVGATYSAVVSGLALWRAARVQDKALKSRTAEAAKVRVYAHEVMSLDRRFAADLLAAADRHERDSASQP
jgi:hypothetical protein